MDGEGHGTSKLKHWIQSGWPTEPPEDDALRPFIIDAHSKWLDVHITPTTSTSATVEALRKLFSMFGLPEVVASDNVTGFTSDDEFKELMQANGVKHICTPYLLV